MKLKYYLRGLGIGIIVTTVILMISFSGRKEELTDDEIITRAKLLGMVMPEEDPAEGDTAGNEGDAAGDALDDEAGTPADDAGAGSAPPADGANSDSPGSDAEPQAGGSTGDPEHITVGAGTAEPSDPDNAGAYRLTVSRGDVCRVICEDLAANGVIDDAEALRGYLLQIGYASHISVGEYDIPYGLTNEEIADILKAGPIEE